MQETSSVPVHYEQSPREYPNRLAAVVNELDVDWQEGYRSVRLFGDDLNQFGIIYGVRLIDDDSGRFYESVPLEELSVVHRAITEKVLTDESGFEARVTNTPDPHNVTGSKVNTDEWLRWISVGVWPMPTYSKAKSPSLLNLAGLSDPNLASTDLAEEAIDYIWDHDYSNAHLANCVLFPKEISDRLRTAATIEYDWRTTGHDTPIILPGETADGYEPTFRVTGFTGEEEQHRHNNGARLIDQVTDQLDYIKLLTFFVMADDPQDIAETIGAMELQSRTTKHFRPTNPNDREFNDKYFLWDKFRHVADSTIALENYSMRHQAGRNMTDLEQQKTIDETLSGLLRVSNKIRFA